MPQLPPLPRDAVIVQRSGVQTPKFADWMLLLWTALNRLIAGLFEGGVFERGRTVAMGDWIPVPFNAANFTANGLMTWTVVAGNQVTFAYTMVGSTMIVAWHLVTTSVGGTLNNQLRIALPAGAIAVRTMQAASPISNAGNLPVGFAQVEAGATFIQVFKADQANWVASVNTTSTRGQIAVEVQLP